MTPCVPTERQCEIILIFSTYKLFLRNMTHKSVTQCYTKVKYKTAHLFLPQPQPRPYGTGGLLQLQIVPTEHDS
jgi:hypothetical protein